MNSGENAFEATLAEYAEKISGELESRLSDESPAALYNAAKHPIRAGGMRLRPTLVLLVAEAFGVDADEQEAIIPAAAAVELVHTLSIVHNDVIDEETMRRREPTTHTVWDTPTAILTGDVLFPKALETLFDTNVPTDALLSCQSELLNGCRQVFNGRSIALSFDQEELPTETEYIEMARLKTGSLFEASVRIGAIVAGANEVEINRIGAYGRNLGIAHHIYDGVVDIVGEADVLRKTSDTDILHGKETLVALHARRRGLDLSGSDPTAEEMISTFESTGSIRYARDRALEYAQTAQRFLDPLPETPARRHLFELGDLVINRV